MADGKAEAAEVFRTLVDQVRLVPDAGELAIVLRGDLAAILRFAAGKKNPDVLLEAGAWDGLISQGSVVAGTRKRVCYNFWPGRPPLVGNEVQNPHSILSMHRNALIFKRKIFLLTVEARSPSRQNFSLMISKENSRVLASARFRPLSTTIGRFFASSITQCIPRQKEKDRQRL